MQVIGFHQKAKVALRPGWELFVSPINPEVSSPFRHDYQLQVNGETCHSAASVSTEYRSGVNSDQASTLSRSNSVQQTWTIQSRVVESSPTDSSTSLSSPRRGRIQPLKAEGHCLSAANRVRLVKFLRVNPTTPRAKVIDYIRHVMTESGQDIALEDPETALADLLQPDGLVVSDDQGRCSLRPLKAEGCMGDSSKLSWIPQIWQDASRRSSEQQLMKSYSSLPVGFSLKGEVVASEGDGQYWFKPDNEYCDGVPLSQISCRLAVAESVELGRIYTCK